MTKHKNRIRLAALSLALVATCTAQDKATWRRPEQSGRALPPSEFRPQPGQRGPQGAGALGWGQRKGFLRGAAAQQVNGRLPGRLLRTVTAGGGYVYAEFDLGGVMRIAPDGQQAPVLIQGQRINAQATAADHRGDAYIVGWFPGNVGESLAMVTPAGAAVVRPLPPQVRQPEALAVDSRTGDVYLAGISQLWKLSPKGALTAVGIGWRRPNSLAVDAAGNLFVSDGGVFKVLPDGSQTNVTAALHLRPFSQQSVLATDRAGNLYACCALEKIAGDGVVTRLAPELAFEPTPQAAPVVGSVSGLAADDLGNLYLADGGGNRVIEVLPGGASTVLLAGSQRPIAVAANAQGEVATVAPPQYGLPGHLPKPVVPRLVRLSAVGAAATLPTGALEPGAVALDAKGGVYFVAQNRNLVYRRAPDGALSEVPAHGYDQIFGIAVDAGGNVYLTDSNHHRVLRVAPDGAQTPVGYGFETPVGLAVDKSGNLYVADAGANRVVKITPGGAQSEVPAQGLSRPMGVAVDAAGDLFIADFGNKRAVEVTVGGAQRHLSTPSLAAQGIAVDGAGNIYLAAGNDGLIRLTPGGGVRNLAVRGLAPRTTALEPETITSFTPAAAATPELDVPPLLRDGKALYLLTAGCELDRWGRFSGGSGVGLYFAAKDGTMAGARRLGGCGVDDVLNDQQGHLYVVAENDVQVIHEAAALEPDFYDGQLADTTGLNPASLFAYFYQDALSASAVDGESALELLAPPTPFKIERFLGDAPPNGPRIVPGLPSDYRTLRYSGALAGRGVITGDDYGKGESGLPAIGGAALAGGVGVPPLGVPAPNRPIAGPLPAALPAGVVRGSATVRGSGVTIMAASARYFVIALYPERRSGARGGPEPAPDRMFYDRTKSRWSPLTLSAAAGEPRASLWGDWLEWRRRDGLQFRNLADGRRLTLTTGDAGTEVLTLSGDELIYRVADRINRVQIIGTSFGAAQLLVHAPLAASVHWAFWSAPPTAH
ncbi:MAG: virginiamycin B lyase family protein [Terriglobales bacterium]